MKWLNWPPARGPKPPELERKVEYGVQIALVDTFHFKQPRAAREERLLLVEAALDLKYRELGGKDKNPTIEWLPVKPRGARLPSKFSADVDYRVQAIARLDFATANEFVQGVAHGSRIAEIAPRVMTVDLTYPLSIGVRMKIRPFVVTESWGEDDDSSYRSMSVGYILWQIACQYERIYSDWKSHGVWGHSIEELRFVNLKVSRGRCKVEVQAE